MKPAKRLLAALLAMAMLVCMLPASVFAADEEDTADAAAYTQAASAGELTSGGEFVIAAEYDGTYYALNTEIDGKISASGYEISVTDGTVSGNDLPVWTLAACGSGVSLYNGSEYLAYSGTTKDSDLESADAAYEWSITVNDDGTISLTETTLSERVIGFNQDKTQFGAYKSSDYVLTLVIFKSDASSDTDSGTDTADPLGTILTKVPADGDEIVIYYNAGDVVCGTDANDSGSGLAAMDCEVTDDGIYVYEGTAVFTVGYDESTGYYTFAVDGKYLSAETSNDLSLEDELTDYAYWTIEAADGGWNVKSVNGTRYSSSAGAYVPVYLEYYSNAFTTYSYSSSTASAYLFNFYSFNGYAEAPEEEEEEFVFPDSMVVNVGADEESVIVTWYDNTEEAGTLSLTDGETAAEFTASVEAASKDGCYINTVTLTDLEPSTEYSFVLTSASGSVSETYTYTTTAFGDGESFSFAVAGDPQIGASGNNESDTEGWAETVEAITSDGTDYSFLFTLGDQINAYYSGTDSDYYEDEYDGFLSVFSTEVLPLAVLVGNHDAGNDDSSLYTEHFETPNTTEYGENQDGDGDYYFTYNGVLIMVLNSSNLSIAEHKTFMEETIAANPDATWTIVAFHKSIYSVASHVTESDIETLRDGLSPIFYELDIDLVLQGHDHVYARSYIMNGETGMEAVVTDEVETYITNPDGVQYVTLNSASGSKYYNITSEAFTYTAVQNQEKTQNYSSVTVTGSTITVTTYRTTDGSVVDTFTLVKCEHDDLTYIESIDLYYCEDCGLYYDADGNVVDEDDIDWPFEPDSMVVNIGADEDSIIVTWYDTEADAGTLSLSDGEATAEYTASVEAASKTGYYINTVTIEDLEPSTEYTIQLTSSSGAVSEPYYYTTTDFGDGNTFTFAAVGDPQIGASGNADSDTEGWAETVQTILADDNDYSFLFSLGDQVNAYYNGTNGETVEDEYTGYLTAALDSSCVLPMAVLVGNHDAGSDNSTLYVEHYETPNTTEYGENQDGDGDYYFTYNGVLFMVLNSSNLSIAEHQAFMEETIAANPDATWTIVAFHKSIYSVASHVTESDIETLRNGLSPIFYALDIDLVLQGHDHVYARSYIMGGETGMEAVVTDEVETYITNPDGVQYVTLNSASGSKYYNITSEAFTYTAVQNQEKTPNYTAVTVSEDEITLVTYRTSDGSVVDEFTIHKCADLDDLTYVEAKDATATEDGNIAYYYCETCGTYYDTDGNEIDADSVIIPAAGESDNGSTNAPVTPVVPNPGATSPDTDSDDTDTDDADTGGTDTGDTDSDDADTDDTDTGEDDAGSTVISFTDDDGTGSWTWASDAIYALAEAGIVEGYEDGTYLPDNSLTRAEAAAIIARAYGLTITEGEASLFDDVSDDHWAVAYINACAEAGIVSGRDTGDFDAEAAITRAEMTVMIARAEGLTIDSGAAASFTDTDGHWASAWIEACASAGLVEGIGNDLFAPDADITRAQMAVLIARAFGLIETV